MKIHMDLDCFFASAERISNLHLNGKTIAVGGRSDAKIFDRGYLNRKLYDKNNGAFVQHLFHTNNSQQTFRSFFTEQKGDRLRIRGIITTASYEARAFGVKTAMLIKDALDLCPNLIVLPPNHLLYHELSHKLHEFLKLRVPVIEQYSVDEFFGDISGWIDEDDAYGFCKGLQEEIKEKFGLPISFGIANSKWAAKLVTGFAKPYGVKEVKKEDWDDFISKIPISEFPGIARGYITRLSGRNIKYLGDIKQHRELFYSWKKPGIILYNRVTGVDNEIVIPSSTRKSIGIGRTFDPIHDRAEIKRRAIILARNLSYTIIKLGLNPTTYSIKIKYEYEYKNKYRMTTNRLFNEKFFKQLVLQMFELIDNHPGHSLTFIGISTFNFMESKNDTYDILNLDEDQKHLKLTRSMQSLRNKYGVDIIKTANEI